MPTIGVDCDITLTHPSVNGGSPVGFILQRSSKSRLGGVVNVQRQAYTTAEGGYSDRLRWWMNIALADNLRNPNGSKHSESRAAMYAFLLEFLAARSGIALAARAGVWVDLHATLTTTNENLGDPMDSIVLSLNNGAFTQSAPIDLARFNNSRWDGPLTWDTSYWR